jgi:hypothetical protein
VITQLRGEAAAIAGNLGVTVHDTVPEEVQPPCVIVQPADPFVVDDDPDATFGEPYGIGFELHLLVPLDDENSNAEASKKLDTMLDDLLEAIAGTSWRLQRMEQPGALATTDWVSHGQRVTIRRTTSL